ncbi:MAG: bifunctional riboflavin kinase/FAD synthetase [Candidatus Omnitrophota bacterium]|nr:bifunctional riboflavin kinase/FAD synthetase [Candidatus Omnitrophota bacterium]
MRIIKGLKNLRSIRKSCVTIGVFDGVHIGHRKIIGKVVEAAKRVKLSSVVLTFDQHPLNILNTKSRVPSLISLKHRIKLIEELGVAYLVVLNFTKSFSRIPPEKFVRDILIKKIGAKIIYTGHDFYFGKAAEAGPELLKKLSFKLGFKAEIVKPVKVRGRVVSSSAIRDYISKGELEKAQALLGRPVSILGTVVKGTGLARHLGYPTANVNPHHETIPPTGVYAVRIKFGSRRFNGVLNIGTRPTFYSPTDLEPSIEVHIFNFVGDIYGKDIEVLFVKKIREERKFKVIAGLVSEIKADEKKALQILKHVLI